MLPEISLLNTSSSCEFNFLLLALSFADLATSALVTPMVVGRVILLLQERVVCALEIINVNTDYFLAVTSHLLIIIVTIERYIYVAYPYWYDQHITKTKAYIAMFSLMLTSAFFTILSYIVGRESPLRKSTPFISTLTHTIFIYFQTNVFMFVKKKTRTVPAQERNGEGRGRKRSEQKDLIAISYISLSFLICADPWNIFTSGRC